MPASQNDVQNLEKKNVLKKNNRQMRPWNSLCYKNGPRTIFERFLNGSRTALKRFSTGS
jgi:hypothetical protein